jgi:hypothetical protein
MSNVPRFRKRRRDMVESFAARVFSKADNATHLRRLIGFEDGHWRAVFEPAYFTLTEGRTEPSKSQWNTLKKRMKRIDPSVFIFREYGDTHCDPESDATCLYVDFGFFEN